MQSLPQQNGAPSVASVVILYLIVAACGLYALPALLASGARQVGPSSPTPVAAVLWILGAAILVIIGVALAPAFDRAVRAGVRQTPWFKTEGPHAVPAATTGWISFPIVAVVNLALVETILRPALMAILGGPINATSTDAFIAVGCLILLLLLLARLQITAAPWLEAGAWYTLDAVMATSNSEGARRFYDTGQHRTRAVITQRDNAASSEATRLAPDQQATVFAGDATLVAPASDDTGATVSALDPAAQATILADRPTTRGER